jgi:hypothetical protein
MTPFTNSLALLIIVVFAFLALAGSFLYGSSDERTSQRGQRLITLGSCWVFVSVFVWWLIQVVTT